MTTLKTLREATAQEVFDQVATHLLKQGKRCVDPYSGICQYRFNGLKCAAGCLISDEEYDRDKMEWKSWGQLIAEDVVESNNHEDLIRNLQDIHDGEDIADWKDLIIGLAKEKGLSYENIL